MNNATTISRAGAGAAALVLVTGAALAGQASAKDGADDNPRPSDAGTSASRTADQSSRVTDDSRARAASDDSARASSSSRARRAVRGNCTAATDWKLTAKARNGRIEVEFEVDSNVAGQRWTYKIRHDRTVIASGVRTTTAPSGSFSVEKRLRDVAGKHTISATARNARTGESCRATVRM